MASCCILPSEDTANKYVCFSISLSDTGQNSKWLLLGKRYSDVEKSKSFWNTSTREAGSQTLHYSNPKSFLGNMILNFQSSPGFDFFKYLNVLFNLQSEMTPSLLSAFPWTSIIFHLLWKKQSILKLQLLTGSSAASLCPCMCTQQEQQQLPLVPRPPPLKLTTCLNVEKQFKVALETKHAIFLVKMKAVNFKPSA